MKKRKKAHHSAGYEPLTSKFCGVFSASLLQPLHVESILSIISDKKKKNAINLHRMRFFLHQESFKSFPRCFVPLSFKVCTGLLKYFGDKKRELSEAYLEYQITFLPLLLLLFQTVPSTHQSMNKVLEKNLFAEFLSECHFLGVFLL